MGTSCNAHQERPSRSTASQPLVPGSLGKSNPWRLPPMPSNHLPLPRNHFLLRSFCSPKLAGDFLIRFNLPTLSESRQPSKHSLSGDPYLQTSKTVSSLHGEPNCKEQVTCPAYLCNKSGQHTVAAKVQGTDGLLVTSTVSVTASGKEVSADNV